jgi:ABC-2 type transport system ATP-binding protein
MNAIEIRGLEKHYKGFDLHLDLDLPKGCILGLIGENGAGKSTTIKAILGMIRPDAGEISVLGHDNSRNCAPVREEIGVVLDEAGLPECLNALQLGRVMAGIFKKWDAAVYEDYLRRLSIPTDKPFKEFSRGMKMKQAIAVALSHPPKLLVLDEATSGLDPVVRDEVVELFSDFTRDEEHAVLISSHIVSDLEKLCDYIAFMHNGNLMLCEEKDALLEKYRFINLTEQQLSELDPAAIKGKKVGKFSVEAIADVEKIPSTFNSSPVTIEDLFVFMAKEEK